MSGKDGGPAFPRPYSTDGTAEDGPEDGMTLRDRFAIAVVEGWGEGFHSASRRTDADVIASGGAAESYEMRVARFAYALADAMLAERGR